MSESATVPPLKKKTRMDESYKILWLHVIKRAVQDLSMAEFTADAEMFLRGEGLEIMTAILGVDAKKIRKRIFSEKSFNQTL